MGESIGNIGAWPIYASIEDIPPALLWPGMKLAVWRGGDFYEFFEVRASRGLGGFWSSLISIGGVMAAPFTGGLSMPLSQLGAGVVGQKEAQGAAQKQNAAQFDQMAAQVTGLFNQIQARPTITAQDVAQAEQAYSKLAQAAAQLASITYVSSHWNSASYKPAYESRLNQIRAAAQGARGGGAAQSETPGASSNNQTLLIVAAAAVAVLMLRRGQSGN
jgi:hypothetical protein